MAIKRTVYYGFLLPIVRTSQTKLHFILVVAFALPLLVLPVQYSHADIVYAEPYTSGRTHDLPYIDMMNQLFWGGHKFDCPNKEGADRHCDVLKPYGEALRYFNRSYIGVGFRHGIYNNNLPVLARLFSIAAESRSAPKSCDFSGEISPRVTVKITNLDIEGAVLEMPRDYIISLAFKSGQLRDGLLMRADADDFSSYPKIKYHDEKRKYKGANKNKGYIQILISNLSPMEEIFLYHFIFLTSNHKHGKDDELVEQMKFEPVSGLKDLLRPVYPGKITRLYDDIFVNKNGAEVKAILTCDKIGRVPYPRCNQVFEVDAYDVKISYDRNLLPRWKELRDGVSDLLKCFTKVKPVELSPIKSTD